MNKFLFIFFILFIQSQNLLSQFLPTLPNTSSIVSCFPDTTGYTRVTVGPGKDFTDLQNAIDAVDLGSVIEIDAGVVFNGGYILKNKTVGAGWIILVSSQMNLLSLNETRIDPAASTGDITFPTQQSAMPKIITNNLSGIPCFKTEANAHHYRLTGLEITADTSVTTSYGLINLGDGSVAQNSLSLVPDQLILDRCYIHGHTNSTIMKFGVRLDCSNGAIIDSYISDFHSIGFDAQAISGINGPGPFKIINNYLEGSGENILFGGGAPAIPGLVPSDIEIRQNYFYKPWSWKVGHPSYAGKHWTIKNLFELKTGMRVLLDGNILENSWADLPTGQSGYAVLLTISTEGGAAPQAEVSDVTISNNIFRHVGAGITFSGTQSGQGNRSKRIHIYNNIFEDINGPLYGDQNTAGPNDGTFLKIGEPQDVIVDHNTILQTGPITWAFDTTNNISFTNNIFNSYVSSGGYQGIYGPGVSQGNNSIAKYFPDMNDANQTLHKNVFIGGNSVWYSNFNTLSVNYFPLDSSLVGFTDITNAGTDYHNYALLNSSFYYLDASNSTDIGVNIPLLDSSFNYSRSCPPIINLVDMSVIASDAIRVFPNPSDKLLTIKLNENIELRYLLNDINEKTIYSGISKTDEIKLATVHFSNGIYFLHLTSANFRIVKKIVINH
jgi:hypothetical protein